jgi:hypothetical protein
VFVTGTALAEHMIVATPRTFIWMALVGVLSGPACSEEEVVACGVNRAIDAGPMDEQAIVKCVQDNRCVGQQPHPACPASPDGAAAICSLYAGRFPVTRGTCGQDTIVFWSGVVTGFFCLYNAQGTLVGSLSGTDSPSYCRRFSRWTWGAEIPEACQRAMHPNLCLPASDGGS